MHNIYFHYRSSERRFHHYDFCTSANYRVLRTETISSKTDKINKLDLPFYSDAPYLFTNN